MESLVFQVLSLMDVDEDGVINLDHASKVIELLGTEHVRIPSKQIRQIIEMLAKEEMLEVELKIEQLLGQPTPTTEAAGLETHPDQSSIEGDSKTSPAATGASDDHFVEEEKVSAKSQNNCGGKTQK